MIDDRMAAILWDAFCDDPAGNPSYQKPRDASVLLRFKEWLQSWQVGEHLDPDLDVVRWAVAEAYDVIDPNGPCPDCGSCPRPIKPPTRPRR